MANNSFKYPGYPDPELPTGIMNSTEMEEWRKKHREKEDSVVFYKEPKCTCGVDHVRCGGRHSTWCDLYKEGE